MKPKILMGVVLPVITVFIVVFLISCSPLEESQLIPSNDQTINARNIFTDEEVNFPHDWQGKVVYVNFFMST